jgi:hypothetical protein
MSSLSWGCRLAPSTCSTHSPFLFARRAVDGTHATECVLWNGMAVFYQAALAALPLGTPLAIVSTRNLPVKQVDTGGGMRTELALNSNPGLEILRLQEGESRSLGRPSGRGGISSPSSPRSLHAPPLTHPVSFHRPPTAHAANLALLQMGAGLPMPDLCFTPLAAALRLPDGAAFSVCGVITRVGPVLRSAAYDADFDGMSAADVSRAAQAEENAIAAANAAAATGGGAPERGRMGSSGSGGGGSVEPAVDSLAVRQLQSTLARTGALGRFSPVWLAHRYVWLRDGTTDTDVVVKLFVNSRLQEFLR